MGLLDKFRKKEKNKKESKKELEQFDFKKAFEENLKFISSKEINPKDIEEQFVKTNTRYFMTVGEVDLPTGNIVVSDPLCFLQSGNFCPILDKTVSPGKYPIEVSICRNKYINIRMCTARLKIKNAKVKRYVLAKSSRSVKDSSKEKTNIAIFPVDAGIMSFCDEQVAKEYINFLDNWYIENKNKNIYDDYFAKLFYDSYMKYPAFQRKDGDFLEWENPNTNNKMVMIASGLGDGLYQCYLGYDKDNEICEVIVPMLNPNLFE